MKCRISNTITSAWRTLKACLLIESRGTVYGIAAYNFDESPDSRAT